MFRVNSLLVLHPPAGARADAEDRELREGDSITLEELQRHNANVERLKELGVLTPVGDEPAGGHAGVRVRSEDGPDYDALTRERDEWRQKYEALAGGRQVDAAARAADAPRGEAKPAGEPGSLTPTHQSPTAKANDDDKGPHHGKRR